MVRIKTQTQVYVCRFHVNCRECDKELYHKYCIGKRKKKRFCIICALRLNIITIRQVRQFNIPIAIDDLTEAYNTKQIPKETFDVLRHRLSILV